MANKPLKSIKFPELPDTYTIPQVDLVPTQGSTNAVSSGGAYSALQAVEAQIPQIDSTLSQSGQAADALETGKIKNKVETLTAIEYTETSGYYDASGGLHNPTSNDEVYTQDIPVVFGQSINVDYSLESNKSMWVGVVAYNSNKIFISRTLLCDNVMGKSFSESYTAPDGVAFVRIMWRYGSTASMSISYTDIPFDFIFSTRTDLENTENTLKQITSKNLLRINTSGRVHNGITFSVDKDAGTITANGTSTNISFVDAAVFIPEKSGQYKITGTPSGGGTSKWYTSLVGQARQDVGGGSTYELTGGTAYTVRVIIAKNQTIENLIFQPKIYDINLSAIEKQAILGAFPLRRELYYDHLFIDTINTVNAVIPSESLFNINTSKRLGFSVIEANVQKTSDNVYVVMHGVADGQGYQTFGSGFYALNDDDISNVPISSVTLEYIKTNVRYNSIYAKYRVAPLTLAEFLTACKKEKLIPLVQCVDEDMCKICDEIMGASNWIAYNAERSWTNAIIMTYKSVTNYEQALNFVGLIGHPCMLCISNVAQITDENMLLIIRKLHHYGYFVGNVCAYDHDEKTQKLLDMGIDFSASGWNVPLFEDGNICNLIGNVDFTDFTTTGNAENGTITLDSGETITPAQELHSVFLSKGYLCVRFEGTITITLGTKINNTFTSDGTKFLSLSTYFLNAVPTFSITATSATIVYDIVYKASKC